MRAAMRCMFWRIRLHKVHPISLYELLKGGIRARKQVVYC